MSATLTPEMIAQAKRLYDGDEVIVAEIAKLLDISERVLYRYIEQWGWTKRSVRRARQITLGREISANPAAFDVTVDLQGLIRDLETRTKLELNAIHAGLASIDGDKSARSIAALARALTQLKALGKTMQAETNDTTAAPNDDEGPRTIEQLRTELESHLARSASHEPAEDVAR